MDYSAISIFLCYATEDKNSADALFLALKRYGCFVPWMDKPPKPFSTLGIPPGADWDQVIRSMIRRADCVIALLSKHSVSKRGYVQREIKMALDMMNELPVGEVFLIPVLLDDVQPPDIRVHAESLRSHQWFKLSEGGIEGLIQHLAAIGRPKDASTPSSAVIALPQVIAPTQAARLGGNSRADSRHDTDKISQRHLSERIADLEFLLQNRNGNVRYEALQKLQDISSPAAVEIVRKTHIFSPEILYGDKAFEFEVRGRRIVANGDGRHPGMVFVDCGQGPGFWMDMFPVTVEQFFRVRGGTFVRSSVFEDSPVHWVTPEEALAFARAIGKRVPSEREWELAAAGPAHLKYPWGDEPDADRCRCGLNWGARASRVNTVYHENVSDFGCFDMAGNVWEWTSDPANPSDPTYGNAARGGAWDDHIALCSCFSRSSFFDLHVIHSRYNVGFRCCQ
jgi:hypothetical protein